MAVCNLLPIVKASVLSAAIGWPNKQLPVVLQKLIIVSWMIVMFSATSKIQGIQTFNNFSLLLTDHALIKRSGTVEMKLFLIGPDGSRTIIRNFLANNITCDHYLMSLLCL